MTEERKPWTGVSPSQITDFQLCPRKWWFRSIAREVVPQKPSAKLGEAIHAQLEAYIKFGVQPKHPGAYAAVPFIPERGEGLLVEARIEAKPVRLAGMLLRGRIDLLNLRNLHVPEILDYKTTGRPEFAKTDEQIAHDVQVIAYGGWACLTLEQAESVIGTLLYIPTKGGKPFPRTATLSRPNVLEKFAALETEVTAMKQTSSCTAWEDVEPNYNACRKFGGCFFQQKCAANATSKERLIMKFGETAKPVLATGVVPPDAPVPAHRKPVEAAAAPVPPVAQPLTEDDIVIATPLTVPDVVQAPNMVVLDDLKKVETPKAERKPRAKKEAPPTTAEVSTNIPKFTLFIDCAELLSFEKSAPVILETLIAKHAEKICEREGVADVRLVPYGQGKGLLCGSIRAAIPEGDIFARSGELSDAVIEALIPHAWRVIRGTR